MVPVLRQIDASDNELLRTALSRMLDGDGPAVYPRRNLKRAGIPVSVDSEVGLVVETSGSRGRPKRVWHTPASLQEAAKQVNDRLAGPGLWWKALPSHYIAGVMVMVRAITSGSDIIFRKSGQEISQSVVEFASEASERRRPFPRFTSLVPKQLSDLMIAAGEQPTVAQALAGFDQILLGGQQVPEKLMAKAEGLGLSVTRTYGSAETAGGCVWDGKPLPNTEISTIGNRIALSGPMLAGGYLEDPERTAQSFVRLGDKDWFVTDDVGNLRDGILRIVGRSDRVIVSAGEKISLDEVEATLVAEFEFGEFCAISVGDDTWGEAIGVISTTELNAAGIQVLLRKQFGRAAQLAWTVQIAEFPRLSSGKVNVLELERLYGSAKYVGGVK